MPESLDPPADGRTSAPSDRAAPRRRADEAVASTRPQSGQLRRSGPRRSWAERALITIGVIGTTLALLSAGVLAWGLGKWQAIESVALSGVDEAKEGEAINWLLVGSDSRDGISEDDPNAGVILGEGVPAGKRTDTIIIARVDPVAGQIHLLSVPRDLLVTYAGGGEGRINATFNGEGGEQRLLDTVEMHFDLEIHHYAEINFVGFQDVVEAIGGVPIWFDRPMRDIGSGLDVSSAGCHTLNGSQALAFARGRNLEYFDNGSWRRDGTGDLGRNSRQQYFLRRVASTAVGSLDITDLGTINRLLDAGGRNFIRDETVSLEDLVRLARSFATMGNDQIISHTLPVFDFRTSTGAAVLGMDHDAAAPVLAVFRGEEAPPVPVVTPVAEFAVLNGNRVAGQASEISSELGAVGVNVESISNAPTTETTVIRYPTGLEEAAARMASYLVAGPAFEVDDSLEVVQLVTGTDFQGLRQTPRENVTVPVASPTAGDPASTQESASEAASPTEAAVAAAPVVGVVPGPTPEGTLCG